MASKLPRPQPPEICGCYLLWQKDLCRCGPIPGFSQWVPSAITGVKSKGDLATEEEIGDVTNEARGWSDGRRGWETRNAGASRGWKRERNKPPLPALGSPKVSPPDHLDIVTLISDLWPPELEENTSVFF